MGSVSNGGEYMMYGSNRLGIKNANNLSVANWGTLTVNYTSTGSVSLQSLYAYVAQPHIYLPFGQGSGSRALGLKQYELNNHLGNVLVTVSDKKLTGTFSSGIVTSYVADIQSFQDYYAFGMIQPGRYNTPSLEYKFGFNSQEKDDEISGVTGANTTAMFWEYDTRLGRRWNLDPEPNAWQSNYAVFLNNPIWHNDVLGNSANDNFLRDSKGNLLAITRTDDNKDNYWKGYICYFAR